MYIYKGNVHCDPIGGESASGGVVLETAEEVVVSDSVELGVPFEAVHLTLAFDGVGALNVEVVGKEKLRRTVEPPLGRRSTPPPAGSTNARALVRAPHVRPTLTAPPWRCKANSTSPMVLSTHSHRV